MSSVRMCDKCGTIFSERATDWQTGSITTVDEHGVVNRVQEDRCPACSVGTGKGKAPKPRLEPAELPQ